MAQETGVTVELVVWHDHEGLSGWTATDAFEKWATEDTSTVCMSVGFLVYEDTKSVVLANAAHANGWGDGQKILKADIQERRTLRRWRRPILRAAQ